MTAKSQELLTTLPLLASTGLKVCHTEGVISPIQGNQDVRSGLCPSKMLKSSPRAPQNVTTFGGGAFKEVIEFK